MQRTKERIDKTEVGFDFFLRFVKRDAFDCSADALIKLLILSDRSK